MTIATIYWDTQDPNNVGWVWRYDGDSGPLAVAEPGSREATAGELAQAFRDQVGPIEMVSIEIIGPDGDCDQAAERYRDEETMNEFDVVVIGCSGPGHRLGGFNDLGAARSYAEDVAGDYHLGVAIKRNCDDRYDFDDSDGFVEWPEDDVQLRCEPEIYP